MICRELHDRYTLRDAVVKARHFLGRRLLDATLADIDSDARYAMVRSYGGYTTNVPLEDLKNHQAWVAFRFEGQDLAPEQADPRACSFHIFISGRARSGSRESR